MVKAPVYHPKVYQPAPTYHQAPKKYGFSFVTTEAAPAAVEPEVKAAEPEVVEEEAPVEAEASSYEAPAPATEAAPEAERYRYYRY